MAGPPDQGASVFLGLGALDHSVEQRRFLRRAYLLKAFQEGRLPSYALYFYDSQGRRRGNVVELVYSWLEGLTMLHGLRTASALAFALVFATVSSCLPFG